MIYRESVERIGERGNNPLSLTMQLQRHHKKIEKRKRGGEKERKREREERLTREEK